MTKEEIAAKYITCTCGEMFKSRKMVASDCQLCQEDWAEPMEEYAKQEAIEFYKFGVTRAFNLNEKETLSIDEVYTLYEQSKK